MATSQLYWPYPPEEVGTWIWGYPGHQGTDWPKPKGTPIPATSDGVIVFAGDDGLGGLTIDLKRGDGLIQRFGHLSAFNVVVGQQVRAGDIIGYVGSTGNSTGPHLHWELRWDRVWTGGKVVDPRAMNPATFGKSPEAISKILEDQMSNPIISVPDKNGTLYIGTADGFFVTYGTPTAKNSRGIISKAFFGAPNGEVDTIPALSWTDFKVAKTVWKQMCAKPGKGDA